MQEIAHITLLVKEYDEAIKFYSTKLRFKVVNDTWMSESKRWVLIAPQGSAGTSILLTKAITEKQKELVGNQTGGKVFMFLYTDNIAEDCESLRKSEVVIVEEMEEKPHGKVLIFEDLYGNKWDLIEPNL